MIPIVEEVYIGKKDISKYISSCFYALKKYDKVKLISRGSHVKKSLDILAILIRDYLEEPEYNVIVKSEEFEGRHITALEIDLTGKRKEEEMDGKD